MNETIIEQDPEIQELLDQLKIYANLREVHMVVDNQHVHTFKLTDNSSITEGQKIIQLQQYLDSGENFDSINEIFQAVYFDWLDVLKWFGSHGFEFTFINHIVNHLSYTGNVRLLQWLLDNGFIQKVDKFAVETAFVNKSDTCLKFWQNSGLELECSINHLAEQSVPKIEWYLNLGASVDIPEFLRDVHESSNSVEKMNLIYEYCQKKNITIDSDDCNFIDRASREGAVTLIQWWIDRGLQLIYTEAAFNNAPDYQTIKWWIESGLPLKYNKYRIVRKIITSGNVDTMILIINNGLISLEDVSQHVKRTIDLASGSGHVPMLEWLVKSGIELNYSELAIEKASQYGQIAMLNWWFTSGLEFKYTSRAIDQASRNFKIESLNWWLQHQTQYELGTQLELKYTEQSLPSGSYIFHHRKEEWSRLFEWWLASGLEVKYDNQIIDYCSEVLQSGILIKFFDSGLEVKYTEAAFKFNYIRYVPNSMIHYVPYDDIVKIIGVWLRGKSWSDTELASIKSHIKENLRSILDALHDEFSMYL